MYSKNGDEKDGEGKAKDKMNTLLLKSLEGESTEQCFVHLEVSVYPWIRSVAQAPSGSLRRED
jgi:hypothetical protein